MTRRDGAGITGALMASVPRVSYPVSGWLEALGFNVAAGLLGVVYAYGAVVGAHPIAFVLDSMLLAAVAMLAIAGPGPDWRRVILMPQSWIVGAGTILMEVFFFLLLAYVHPALGSALIRAAVLATMLAGFVLAGRVPGRQQLLGNAIIALAVLALFSLVRAADLLPAALAVLGCMAMLAIRTFGAEFHPVNRAATTVMAKIRFTGLAVLVTSLFGLLAMGLGGALVAAGVVAPGGVVPGFAQLVHGPTLALAAFAGVFALTAMAFCNYSAVVKITAENMVAMTGLTPLITLALQEAAAALGLIERVAIAPLLLAGMAAIAGGAMVTVTGAARRG